MLTSGKHGAIARQFETPRCRVDSVSDMIQIREFYSLKKGRRFENGARFV